MIRRFTADDLDRIAHLQPPGWTDIRSAFVFYLSHDFCHPVSCCAGRAIVGVGCAVAFGARGWLAHIIVDPKHRRRGLGLEITTRLVEILERLGASSQLLIATEMGQPLYEKLGFTTSHRYLFFESATQTDLPLPRSLRRIESGDTAQIFDLDLRATGEDRKRLLDVFLSQGWVHQNPEPASVDGFLLPTLGEGLIIAGSRDAGIGLLQLKQFMGLAKTVLPESNRSGLALFWERGCDPIQSAARMVRGGTDPLDPSWLYSRIGGNFG